MEYALWKDEPMGPVFGGADTGANAYQPPQNSAPGNGLQVPHQSNPVQQVVMDSRPPVQQMPLGNGTPSVSMPPMGAAEQTRKEPMTSYTGPAVVVGGAGVAYALTQPELKNVGYYGETADLWYIFVAVLVVDVIILFMTRYFPETLGAALNRWYTSFGLSAVLADVLVIVAGFLLARYIYTNYVEPALAERSWSPWIFIGLLMLISVVHDFGFYKFVVQPMSRGTNAMIDLFKDYAESGGFKIVASDALMVGASALLAMILKGQPDHVTGFVGVLAAYCVPYILHTRPGGGSE